MALRIIHTAVLLLGLVLVAVACGGTEPEPEPVTVATEIPTPTASKVKSEPTATAIPEPTDTPTEVPPTLTPAPVATATFIPEPTPTEVPPTSTPVPTSTPTPLPTETPTPEPIPTSTPTPTPLPTATPTSTPTPTPTPIVIEETCLIWERSQDLNSGEVAPFVPYKTSWRRVEVDFGEPVYLPEMTITDKSGGVVFPIPAAGSGTFSYSVENEGKFSVSLLLPAERHYTLTLKAESMANQGEILSRSVDFYLAEIMLDRLVSLQFELTPRNPIEWLVMDNFGNQIQSEYPSIAIDALSTNKVFFLATGVQGTEYTIQAKAYPLSPKSSSEDKEMTVTKTFTFPNIPETMNISLVEGWNLVSFPVHPMRVPLDSLFVDTSITKVMTTADSLESDTDGIPLPCAPYGEGDINAGVVVKRTYLPLETLVLGKGYWIESSDHIDWDLPISDRNYPNTYDGRSSSLSRGWNLVGLVVQDFEYEPLVDKTVWGTTVFLSEPEPSIKWYWDTVQLSQDNFSIDKPKSDDWFPSGWKHAYYVKNGSYILITPDTEEKARLGVGYYLYVPTSMTWRR